MENMSLVLTNVYEIDRFLRDPKFLLAYLCSGTEACRTEYEWKH